MVTVTHGHGYLNDCNATGSLNDQGAEGVQEILYGDVLRIYGKAGNVANEYCEVNYNFAALGLSPLEYTHYVVRWKTFDSAAPGMGANAYLHFSGGSNQYMVGTLPEPVFNDTWTVNSGTINTPAGNTINELVFVISDNPDTLTGGHIGYAYFDFCLLCKGKFTLPNVAHGLTWEPRQRDITLEVPGRDTDLIQLMGSKNATAVLGCDLDFGTWTTTGYSAYPGQLFDEIAHRSRTEPFQWASDVDGRSFKARVLPVFHKDKIGERPTARLDLELTEYSLGTKENEYSYERWGIT